MTTTRKIILAGILFIASVVALGFFVVVPLTRDVLKNTASLFSPGKEFVQIQANLKQIQTFQEFFGIHASEWHRINDMFVDFDTPIDFAKFFEATAAQSHLSISIAPGVPRRIKDDPWASMNFQISGQGSYPALHSFLKKLEEDPFVSEIQSINVVLVEAPARQGETKALQLLNFSINVKAYSNKRQTAVAAIKQ